LPQVGEDRPQVRENTNHGNKLNMVVKTKTCDEFTRVKTLNEEVAIFVGTELAPYVCGFVQAGNYCCPARNCPVKNKSTS